MTIQDLKISFVLICKYNFHILFIYFLKLTFFSCTQIAAGYIYLISKSLNINVSHTDFSIRQEGNQYQVKLGGNKNFLIFFLLKNKIK